MHADMITGGQLVHAIGGFAADITYDGVRGVYVGEVDHLDGYDYVKLKKIDQQGSMHHWFPVAWVDEIEGDIVYVDKTPEEFRAGLFDENPEDSQELTDDRTSA